MSLTDVHHIAGVSRAQLSRIENGKSDPRMSTITQLLTCYGASLGDLEKSPATVLSLDEVKQRAGQAAEELLRVGLGTSDAAERLARKAMRQIDVQAEREALATRL